ncbi:helix-turn-helix domain-containing protein [Chachezhania antarctica]|uniref:helix-turn-helix domain-containing protein n=1 Tax=Chachezhania antarctica TaxID=2340860 RepID=UPI000EACF954|nr:XRE family transcriptional regulator [Chachezhania antarctica]|tara:strand:- start:6214 stop:6801 length:588 start_codon:yes stop_codon:yes gene_type:complete
MSTKSEIGRRVKQLRKADGLTLVELSGRSGVSVSSISKIENGALSPTLDVILKLCDGLSVSIGDLVSGADGDRVSAPNSRFSPAFKGEGALISTPNYDYLYLCPDVKNKFIMPIHARVKARSATQFGDLVSHGGEEFLYVLEGEVEVHSEFYEPVLLKKGDSVYLDSAMGHAYISAGDADAEVLCICTEYQTEGP